MSNEIIIIMDFGSQYTQLIARKIRNLGVYSEIVPYNIDYEKLKEKDPQALVFSGSPFSVKDSNAPFPDRRIFSMDIPFLGICYGMQLLAYWYGGKVDQSIKKEYGSAVIYLDNTNPLFRGLSADERVWMSHGDSLLSLPKGFKAIAKSGNSPYAAIYQPEKRLYGLQFHPEVYHTPKGDHILDNFLKKIACFSGDWTAASFVGDTIREIRKKAGNRKVLLAMSGGVDSSVTAALLHKAIGENLVAVYVDTGLMRKNETAEVQKLFRDQRHLNLQCVDAKELFYKRLEGISDPEQKRKIIGSTFIEVFDKEALKHQEVDFLAQGTLYPDVIESVSFKGPSATIKSHHNVGGLPEKMNLKVIEPLRELFKDEVRSVGKELGLPDNIINRHPFPGPGLAVRILGTVSPGKIATLQEIDAIFVEELKAHKLYNYVWQAFAVLLPVHSVGVMGDKRTYSNVCALRAVHSIDGMTADWAELPSYFLKEVSTRIINEVPDVNRVVYDISSKPPATIEWE